MEIGVTLLGAALILLNVCLGVRSRCSKVQTALPSHPSVLGRRGRVIFASSWLLSAGCAKITFRLAHLLERNCRRVVVNCSSV